MSGSIIILKSDTNPPTVPTTPTYSDFISSGISIDPLNPTVTEPFNYVPVTNNALNTFYYYLMDKSGNISNIGYVSVHVDQDPPTTSFSFSDPNIYDVSGVKWTRFDSTIVIVNYSDSYSGISRITIKRNGTSIYNELNPVGTSKTIILSGLSSGTNTLIAEAEDRAGNISISSPLVINYDNTNPSGTISISSSQSNITQISSKVYFLNEETNSVLLDLTHTDLESGLF